jgi:hypothetical protein
MVFSLVSLHALSVNRSRTSGIAMCRQVSLDT